MQSYRNKDQKLIKLDEINFVIEIILLILQITR